MTIKKRKIKVTDDDKKKSQKGELEVKKVLYLEIDEEVTGVYEKISKLKHKNIYLVVPRRAVLFQSSVNLKILKKKAEDLKKNLIIVTNDSNGFNLASRSGFETYDKLESHGKSFSLNKINIKNDEEEITPLKASVNSISDDNPSRRNDKKFSISELIRKKASSSFNFISSNLSASIRKDKKNSNNSGGGLVLIAPNKKALISLVFVSVLLLLTISYIALPGATLILTPKSNVIEVPKNVILADIEKNRAELDLHPSNMIPSYNVTTQIDKVFTYQSTGKDAEGGSNARGNITILNTSSNSWPLVPRTRFQTSDGLVFRIDRQVVVPAGTNENPGQLIVEVVADPLDAFGQPVGDRGNISGDVQYFLPALSAENQKRLFATSNSAFTGGDTNIVKYISEEDVEAARIKMGNELKSSATAELQGVLMKRNDSQGTRLTLLESNSSLEYGTPNIDIPPNIAGQRLDSFDVKGSMVVSGIAYDLNDLLSILKREIRLKKNPEKSLASIDEESLSLKLIDYDKSSGKATITATIQGVEEYELSPKKENGERLIKKIRESIVGKDVKEARDFIQNLAEIERVEIQSWPAWAPTLPSVPDNIQVEIKRM